MFSNLELRLIVTRRDNVGKLVEGRRLDAARGDCERVRDDEPPRTKADDAIRSSGILVTASMTRNE